jgi:hypothetical protein
LPHEIQASSLTAQRGVVLVGRGVHQRREIPGWSKLSTNPASRIKTPP